MAVRSSVRTITVSDVERATKPFPAVPALEAMHRFLGGAQPEACSDHEKAWVDKVASQPLVAAAHGAFIGHCPLVLSPDIVWLTILQGLAIHVNQNSERLRHRFVAHEGQLELEVERHQFVKGSIGNDWPGVLAEFSEKIREHIGPMHASIVCDFSTTGPTERAASEIALLDAMQSYFKYTVQTLCGIPEVVLEGSVQDWEKIAARVRAFRDLDLQWWTEPMEPILDELVQASSGSPDPDFWRSLYQFNSDSGLPHITGWIAKLFPYVLDGFRKKRNPWLVDPTEYGGGPPRHELPRLPSRAPFKCVYLDQEFEMEFVGGLVGVSQDGETLALRPEIGWAVRDKRETSHRQPYPPPKQARAYL